MSSFQLYCLYSALVWFTPLLWYPEPPRRVGYPTYGFWLIYSVAEITLFSIFRALRTPPANLILICETLRIALLILLLCATFGVQINPCRQVSLDEESSPLLSPEAPQPAATSGTAYGSCDTQSNETPNHSTKDNTSNARKTAGKKGDKDDQKVWSFWDFVECFKVRFYSINLRHAKSVSRIWLTGS